MSNTTTYATIGGDKVSLTPVREGDFVSVATKTRNVGLYRIDRFGDSPLTPSGRLTAQAVRTFTEYVTGK